MNNNEDYNMVKVNKLFFFVISFLGLIPAIYQTTKGKQTVSEFINNNRNFNLFQLAMTLIATEITLTAVNFTLQECFTKALNGIVALLLGITAWCMIMQYLIPRLNLFFTKRYLGEVIETLAGKPTVIIVNLVIFIGAMLICVNQFKLGMKSAYFLTETQKSIFLWCFGLLIALYVVRGGITSVVNSDILQLALGIGSIMFIMMITYYYIQSDQYAASNSLTNVIRDDISNIKFDSRFLNIFLLMLIPSFSPAYVSRFFLAKDKQQLQNSFKWLNIAYIILLPALYLIARIIFVMHPNLANLDIAQTLKALNFIDEVVLITIFLALFMIAVTTIDSLLQFITVEISTIITKDEEKLSQLFNIIPFILMLGVCILAQYYEVEDGYSVYNIAQMLFLPVVTPIILFYCITGLKFTKPLLPLIGIAVGLLLTLIVYFDIDGLVSSHLNPGIVGGIANLLVLLIGKNFVAHENANN